MKTKLKWTWKKTKPKPSTITHHEVVTDTATGLEYFIIHHSDGKLTLTLLGYAGVSHGAACIFPMSDRQKEKAIRETIKRATARH